MLTERAFVEELNRRKERYRRDNAWVSWWNEPEQMVEMITCAWKLYELTATNVYKLTLLGGTEIRMDMDYIRSFGVTGANGIQDKKTRERIHRIVNKLNRSVTRLNKRDRLASVKRGVQRRDANGNWGYPAAREKPFKKSQFMGGAILSEKGWTPMLNDALIIGATTAGQQFALGLTPDEQAKWDNRNGGRVTKVSVAKSKFDLSECKAAWKAFLQDNLGMLFDDGRRNPRVLARELIGLSTFGYQPEFSWHQLGFSRKNVKASRAYDPTFGRYLDALTDADFRKKDRTRILSVLGEFLFEDPTCFTQRNNAAAN